MEETPHKFFDITAREGIAGRAMFSLPNPRLSEELPELTIETEEQSTTDTTNEGIRHRVTSPARDLGGVALETPPSDLEN